MSQFVFPVTKVSTKFESSFSAIRVSGRLGRVMTYGDVPIMCDAVG